MPGRRIRRGLEEAEYASEYATCPPRSDFLILACVHLERSQSRLNGCLALCVRWFGPSAGVSRPSTVWRMTWRAEW